jgi:hypothetical protein
MLKKAGIVVAVAVAGLVSVSPLAFATDGHDHHGDHGHGHGHGHGHHHSAPQDVDYTNVERNNLSNDCAFAQTGPDVDTTAAGGSSGLLGLGGLVANVVAPVSAPIQALNCTNIGVSDVIDINSNNDTRTATSTEVDGSFNEEHSRR